MCVTVNDNILFHTMARFYVIYRYVFSEWRSISSVEINQYDITIVRVAHCEIKMGNDVAWDIHCDVRMSNDVFMCIYHGIIMHNDVVMNLFYYVLLCLFVLFYYG